MKHLFTAKQPEGISLKAVTIAAVILTVTVLAMTSFKSTDSEKPDTGDQPGEVKNDSVVSVTAFMMVYKVLMNPRCVNCHPAGDVPLQGDDSQLHDMNPKRGKDGKGLYALKCVNCHQAENADGLHSPPGKPGWRLPPSDMKMVFEGKTAFELAKQLIDTSQNGNKDINALLTHADDELVLWGWEPGEGRTLPPVSYAEYKEAWTTWLQTGAYAPAN